MKILIVLGIAIMVILTWSLAWAAGPRTPEERAAEDKIQAKYLAEYTKRK